MSATNDEDTKEKEIQMVKKDEIKEYLNQIECKCGDEFYFIPENPIDIINISDAKVTELKCNECNCMIAKGDGLVFCSNLDFYGIHPGGYYLCIDCTIRMIKDIKRNANHDNID